MKHLMTHKAPNENSENNTCIILILSLNGQLSITNNLLKLLICILGAEINTPLNYWLNTTKLPVEQRLLNSLLRYVFKLVTKQTCALYLHISSFMGWYKYYTYLETSYWQHQIMCLTLTHKHSSPRNGLLVPDLHGNELK